MSDVTTNFIEKLKTADSIEVSELRDWQQALNGAVSRPADMEQLRVALERLHNHTNATDNDGIRWIKTAECTVERIQARVSWAATAIVNLKDIATLANVAADLICGILAVKPTTRYLEQVTSLLEACDEQAYKPAKLYTDRGLVALVRDLFDRSKTDEVDWIRDHVDWKEAAHDCPHLLSVETLGAIDDVELHMAAR